MTCDICVCCKQWLIDSAALVPWNIGTSPDSRALMCLKKRGLSTDHKARQVIPYLTLPLQQVARWGHPGSIVIIF